MKLTGIDIRGFKSFCDFTRIRVDRSRVIAVIGPNGCGKSNIVDAVRWVLGEQSAKHLRGLDMQDVIFAGSGSRPQSGMAAVTLHFDNVRLPEKGLLPYDEFNEITVGRRLFRNGTSEYIINNTPARLKDVRDIFLDTGVGDKGYSVIEQGMIGRIVTSRPEDRLNMIEEAAGIMKFRVKRKEADRKLDHTRQNLHRINDLLAELSDRKESVQKQVEKAERYMAAKSIVEKTTNRMAAYRWHMLQKKNMAFENQLAEFERSATDLETEKSALTARTTATDLEILQRESILAEHQNRLGTLRPNIIERESALKICEERLLNINAWRQREQTDRDELTASAATLKQSLAESRERLAELEEALAAARAAREAAAETRGELKTVRDNLKAKSDTLRSLVEGVHIRISAAEAALAAAHQRLADFQQELAAEHAAAADTPEADTERVNANQEIEALRSQITRIDEWLETLSEDTADAETELQSLAAEVDTRRLNGTRLQEEQLRYRVLIESVKFGGEESGRLAAFLQEHRDEAEACGYVGTFADLFSLKTDGSDEIAAVWERFSECFVFRETAQTAAVSELLTRSGVGRADCYFLDAQLPVPPFIAERYDCLANYLESQHDAAIDITLPRLMLIGKNRLNDLPELIQNGSVYWFDGETLTRSPTGLVRFSNPRAALPSIMRREYAQKLAAVDSESAALTAEIERLLPRIDRQRELLTEFAASEKTKTDEKRELIRTIERLQLEANAREKHQETVARIHREKEARREQLRQKAADAQSTAAQQENSLVELQQALRRHGQELAEANAALDELQDTLSQGEAAYHEQHLREQELANLCANTREKCAQYEQSAQEADARIAKNDAATSRREGDEVAVKAEIARIRADIPVLVKQLHELEQQISAEGSQLEVIRNTKRSGEKKQQELAAAIADLDRQCQNIRIKLAENNKDVALTEESLRDFSGMQPLEVLAYDEVADFDEAAAKKEVERQRAVIAEVGNVNMEAFDEFTALTERLDFLQAQHADLTGSVSLLENAIETMESESEKRFRDTFRIINENLQRVFPMFFGGGSASLSMLEGDANGEKRGVDIQVNIPGKKLRNMSLLSGGEKAMTALSLVFSIFLIKPSPFCVLDEVDAPLDEANVKRFCRAIKTFSDQTRFIVITHNKVTMESADSLIGVTMVEPGVSKTVSVRVADQKTDQKADMESVQKTA